MMRRTAQVCTTAAMMLLLAWPTPSFGQAHPAGGEAMCVADPPVFPGFLRAVDRSFEVVNSALDDANGAAGATQLIRRETLSYSTILDPDRTIEGSLSVGSIRDGALEDAANLPVQKPHLEVIERHRRRNTNYGTDELVDAIDRAARAVYEEYGGAPLRVGNISRRGGGRIPWSRSHQSGRDADIAFYALDERNRSVPTPDLVEFDDAGRADNHDLTFDTARNWALVRALLEDSDIDIQWLFVSEGLKIKMLTHALEVGESEELIERAATVLHQPTDAPPHADHLHLRIACAEIDRLEGCIDWGPFWEWHRDHTPGLLARTRELRRAFDESAPSLRRDALEFLHKIRAPLAPEIALRHGVSDPEETVRRAAFELLDDLPIGTDYGVELLDEAIAETSTPDRLAILYDALAEARTSKAADVAVDHYRNAELPIEQRLRAADALRHRMDPALVPKLVDDLGNNKPPALRAQLASVLRRITAHSHDLDWNRSSLDDEHHRALDRWRQWHERTDSDRQQMLLGFLEPHGVDHWEDLEAIDDLIPLLRSGADHERYNLNVVLSDWTGRWAPRTWGSERGAYEFWSRWWDRNRDRMLEDTDYPWE